MVILKRLYLLTAFLWISGWNYAQSISGIVNKYTKVIEIDTCMSKVTVNSSIDFSMGDLVILIQMNGSEMNQSNTSQFGQIIDYKSAGLYEFGRILNIIGSEIYFEKRIINQYQPSIASVQLVKVPEYQNATVAGTITCHGWDGDIGGIIAMVVNGTLNLNASIDASEKGFRGGIGMSVNWQCTKKDFFYNTPDRNGAMKGEGIAILPSNMLYGRGAPANGGGGGNSTNTGGGGGGLGGTGGLGGYQWGSVNNSSSCYYNDPNPNETPGIGGRSLHTQIPQRAIMGGGGGAGDANDNNPSNGGGGGGIILIQANIIQGNGGQIIANGAQGVDPGGIANEGGGGGGSGGMVWVNVNSVQSSVNISTQGGRGANVRNHGGNHGPGGGGGGGIIRWPISISGPNITTNTQPGVAGILTNFPSNFWGSQPGSNGFVEDTTPFIYQTDSVVHYPTSPQMISACEGDTIVLSAWSSNVTVSWHPKPGLSCTNCPNPTLIVGRNDSVIYYDYLNHCNVWALDSILIQITPVGDPVVPQVFYACEGDTITLYAGTNAPVNWIPHPALSCTNCPNPTIIVDATDTVFFFNYSKNCNIWELDSVRVVITPDTSTASSVTLQACEGETITLSPGTNATVVWNPHPALSCTNCRNPDITVGPGDSIVYYEFQTICGNWSSAFIRIQIVADTTTLVPQTYYGCDGETIALSPGTNTPVRWHSGQGLSCLNCRNPDYTVIQTNQFVYYDYLNNCNVWIKDSVYVQEVPDTFSAVPIRLTACHGDTLLLIAGTSAPLNWEPHPLLSCTNCPNPVIVADSQHYIFMYNYRSGCDNWFQQAVIIDFDNCKTCLPSELPNAFSPNGDGVNDVFHVLAGIGQISNPLVRIYNRWGEKVFESKDPSKGWDGTVRGLPAQLGVYVWILSGVCDGENIFESGNVTLIR